MYSNTAVVSLVVDGVPDKRVIRLPNEVINTQNAIEYTLLGILATHEKEVVKIVPKNTALFTIQLKPIEVEITELNITNT